MRHAAERARSVDRHAARRVERGYRGLAPLNWRREARRPAEQLPRTCSWTREREASRRALATLTGRTARIVSEVSAAKAYRIKRKGKAVVALDSCGRWTLLVVVAPHP
eukprot:scaffold42249_cov67-Phaeocystis_antarctica.AAC.1